MGDGSGGGERGGGPGKLLGALWVRLTLGSEILGRQEAPQRDLEVRDGEDRGGGPLGKTLEKNPSIWLGACKIERDQRQD